MKENAETDLTVRKLERRDLDSLLAMVRELAEFENLSEEMVAGEVEYEESFFHDPPAAEAIVAEREGVLIGYAIFFTTFSTFVGRSGIWLEDLYVKKEHRRLGIGTRLLKSVGEIARERKCGRYEWCVLDWNENAIQLYEKMGGKILDEWRIVRLNRNGIESLGGK